MNQTLQSLVLITLSFFLLFGCTSQSLNTNGSSTNSDASAMNTLGRLPADANAADLLNQFNPSPDQTSLVVIVLPLGANLTVTPIGGTPYSGVSPLYLSNISAGRYNIMASAPGYNNHGTFFTVIENESNLFSMNLTPSLGASVSVETTPSGASITLTGGPSVLSGTSPANFSNLSAGIYQLHITLSGYDNLSGILIVGDGQDQSLSYNLTAANLTSPHATSLEVNVVPVGAHVLASKLNSSENIHYEGTAPLVVSDSEPGRYMIMASATGYQTHGTFFDVLANQDNVFNMTLNALPPQLSLTVNADPAGANVTVSLAGTTTNYLGNAPFSLTNLSAGNYSVQVSAIGYRANITSVELLENQTLDLTLYPFAGASNLTVNTVPGGANVSVRSMKNQSLVYSGISPFTVTDLSVFGTYIISATLPGYLDEVITPPIWDNQSYVFNINLTQITPSTGAFAISTQPPGANVMVSSVQNSSLQYSGISPFSQDNVPVGEYAVQARFGESFAPNQTTITISENQTASANLALYHVTRLLVSVNAPGAHVLASKLNSSENIHYEGTAPLVVSDPEPGRYMIMASATGYQTHGTFFDVLANQNNLFDMVLTPIVSPSSVHVNTDPPGAFVTFNRGTAFYSGVSPFDASNITEAGIYILNATLFGYVPYSEVVSIGNGQDYVFNIALQPLGG